MDWLKEAQKQGANTWIKQINCLRFQLCLKNLTKVITMRLLGTDPRCSRFDAGIWQKDGFITKTSTITPGTLKWAKAMKWSASSAILTLSQQWEMDLSAICGFACGWKVYARGAMDDKGPTMAAYMAMKLVKDSDIVLNKKVRLILGCDEESGMRCINDILKWKRCPSWVNSRRCSDLRRLQFWYCGQCIRPFDHLNNGTAIMSFGSAKLS